MRLTVILPFLVGALAASAADAPAAFSDWPKGADPKTVGARVIAQLLSTEPEAYSVKGCDGNKYGGGKYVAYPVVSLWVNSLEYARLVGDEALRRKLTDLFEPFYPGGAKADKVTKPRHVDFNVFGAVPLEIAIQTGDPRARQMGLRYADDQWEQSRPDDLDVFPGWLKSHYVDPERQLEYLKNGYSGQTRLWIGKLSSPPPANLCGKFSKNFPRSRR